MALPGLYQAFEEKWGKFQTCHIISDTHFGDIDLKENIPNRPNDDDFIKLINSKVGRADIILHLGDVGDIECVRKLKAAYKVLIMGNHDAGRTNYERKIVKRIFDKEIHPDKAEVYAIMEQEYPGWKICIKEDYGFCCPFMRWIAYADNMLFDEVYEGALIVGEKLVLSHEPVEIPWLYNIHGHIHDRRAGPRKNHLNVCSDVIDYEPINFNQFLKSGATAKVQTIHRQTIDAATEKAKKRRYKLGK